jgi:hypothetical protein
MSEVVEHADRPVAVPEEQAEAEADCPMQK